MSLTSLVLSTERKENERLRSVIIELKRKIAHLEREVEGAKRLLVAICVENGGKIEVNQRSLVASNYKGTVYKTENPYELTVEFEYRND